MIRSLGLLLFTVIALAGCGKPEPQAAGRAGLKPCSVAGVENARCGELAVYENRATRSRRKINLNVVVLPALEPDAKPDPLFHLDGGPGVPATNAAGFYATEGKEYRRQRDVVLVDQRGTGKSNGLYPPAEPKTPQQFLTEMYPLEYVRKLRRAVEPRADLTQYTTANAMDDLDDVRAWLGYDRINLVGLSYGTRAALAYMRQHPTRVRSAILIGTAPPDLKMPSFHARGAQRAMNLLLEQCRSDPDCHQAFPELQGEWEELLARLEKQPARVEYSPPDNSAPVSVQIERDIFTEKLRNAMYSTAVARRIPLIVHQAAAGDFAPFLAIAIPAEGQTPDVLADGMYLSVTCAEDVPFIEQASTAGVNSGKWFRNYRVDQQTRACGLWPRGSIPEGYHAPVKSDVPTLLVSGEMDPVTPPELAAAVARELPRSRQVVVPYLAHIPEGLTNLDCLDRVMLEFLDKADASALDLSCLKTMRPVPFAVRDGR